MASPESGYSRADIDQELREAAEELRSQGQGLDPRMPESLMDAYLEQRRWLGAYDDCFAALFGGKDLPARAIAELTPSRAVMLGRLAARMGVGIEGGTIGQLILAGLAAGGNGTLRWPPL